MTYPPFPLPEAQPARDARPLRPKRGIERLANRPEIEAVLSALGIEALGQTAGHLLFRCAGGQVVAYRLDTFGRRHILAMTGGCRRELLARFPTPCGVRRGVNWEAAADVLIEACGKAGVRFADELEAMGFRVVWRLGPADYLPQAEPLNWTPPPLAGWRVPLRDPRTGRFRSAIKQRGGSDGHLA